MRKYGIEWYEMDEFNIELSAFKLGLTVDEGGLGKEQHFKNLVNALWGPHNERKKFVWHPWAEDMLKAACAHKTLAVAGCGSSGKTDFFAIWGIVNFLADPINTMVLVTSTSLKESRKRIWGSIREYWLAVPGLPGKLVDSHGLIRLDDGSGDSPYSEKSGITLIAGEKKKEREAVSKLIGMKNKRVILIADELTDLSEGILGACANLATNPFFQLIGIGNPNSHYDPFGILATPKDGWASINEETSYEWETVTGYCLRFDAERSPNLFSETVLYPWLPTREKLEEAKKKYGEKSVFYFRMYRGFWCPLGHEQQIYTEADIIKFKADTVVDWFSGFTKIAALDPAFTNGGDRSVAIIGKYGRTTEGKWVLLFDRYEYLQEDVTNKAEPRNFQIARAFITLCQKEGISAFHTAVDSTGGGGPFADIIDHLRGNSDMLRVHFGGKATERPVSDGEIEKASEKYANRVTEIWYSGHEFLRTGQLRGIMPALAREMTARLMDTVKLGSAKIRVESKVDMKARMGESPDLADAAFILLDLIRDRFGANPNAAFASEPPAGMGNGGAVGMKKAISRLRVGVKTLFRSR